MRMWMVDPKIMCKNHLLGEHNEIHKHRHSFVKKYNLSGRKGQIEPASMKARHDELAKEMLLRGWNHNSEYSQPDTSHLPKDFIVDVKESLKLLINRCPKCKDLYESKLHSL